MQRPNALGLTVCDSVILDQYTGKRTIVGAFDELACDAFPFAALPLTVYAALTDGQGVLALELRVTDMDEEVELRVERMVVEFPTPLDLGHARFYLRNLTFPEPGFYLFELYADKVPICHRRLRVYSRGGES